MHKMPKTTYGIDINRNLNSHIATLAYYNITPRNYKWPGYKRVSQGAKGFIDIIRKITGLIFEHINPAFLLNEDYSRQ